MKKHFNFIGHMSHTRKKTHTAIYHIFCFFLITGQQFITCHSLGSSSVGGIRERTISAADVAGLVVVFDARVAHERESAGETRVRHEVGAVIKASITRDAEAEFVVVEFLHAFFLSKLESGYMGLRRLHSRRRRAGGSGSPVAGSNMGGGHCSSFVCL